MFQGLYSLHSKFFPKAKPCVSFAQKAVPNEYDGNWKEVSSNRENDNGGVVSTRVSYEHKNAIGLKLSMYNYFGQPAFKAWACSPNGKKGDIPDHMIAVLEDDQWYHAYAQKPEIFYIIDDKHNIVAVRITLLDLKGKTIAVRTISRPQ
ncbi:MAG: hypothetical protein Q7S12_03825 [bacterium]|nr:hypothetical protein [bacterium]